MPATEEILPVLRSAVQCSVVCSAVVETSLDESTHAVRCLGRLRYTQRVKSRPPANAPEAMHVSIRTTLKDGEHVGSWWGG